MYSLILHSLEIIFGFGADLTRQFLYSLYLSIGVKMPKAKNKKFYTLKAM